jgi:membrane protease YdiL (CAAX protease family)
VAEAGPGWLVGLSVAQWLPMLAVVWMLGRRFGVGSPTRDYGFTLRPIDAVGVPIGIATQLLFVPLLYLPLQSAWPKTFESDDVEKRARELWEGASGAGVVLLVLIVAVGAPLVEELIYRGLLQGAVGRRLHHWRGWLAVILVAAMFALVHFAPIEYPGLFLVGLILGACTLRTGRLGMSVLAHAAFNATGLALVAAS